VTIVVASAVIATMGVRYETAPVATVPVRTAAPAVQPREVASRVEPTRAGGSAAHRREPVAVRPARSRVIVPADEVEAFWQLVAAVQRHDVTIPPARWPVDDVTGEIEPLPEIAVIELPAVTIEPLPQAAGEDKVGGTDE
jgi:hypothetical protein